jgi:hypothetical protein
MCVLNEHHEISCTFSVVYCRPGPLFCPVGIHTFNMGQEDYLSVGVDAFDCEGRNNGKKTILTDDCGSGNTKATITPEDFMAKTATNRFL